MAARASSDTTGGAPSSAHNAAASTARTSRISTGTSHISTAHPSNHTLSPTAKSASSTTRSAASHTARLIPPKLQARSHEGFRARTSPCANHGGVAASSAHTLMLCCPFSFVSSACVGRAYCYLRIVVLRTMHCCSSPCIAVRGVRGVRGGRFCVLLLRVVVLCIVLRILVLRIIVLRISLFCVLLSAYCCSAHHALLFVSMHCCSRRAWRAWRSILRIAIACCCSVYCSAYSCSAYHCSAYIIVLRIVLRIVVLRTVHCCSSCRRASGPARRSSHSRAWTTA